MHSTALSGSKTRTRGDGDCAAGGYSFCLPLPPQAACLASADCVSIHNKPFVCASPCTTAGCSKNFGCLACYCFPTCGTSARSSGSSSASSSGGNSSCVGNCSCTCSGGPFLPGPPKAASAGAPSACIRTP